MFQRPSCGSTTAVASGFIVGTGPVAGAVTCVGSAGCMQGLSMLELSPVWGRQAARRQCSVVTSRCERHELGNDYLPQVLLVLRLRNAERVSLQVNYQRSAANKHQSHQLSWITLEQFKLQPRLQYNNELYAVASFPK